MKPGDISCPRCNSKRIAPIFYGMPTIDPVKKENGKNPASLGYAYSPYNPACHCNNCGYEWK